MARRRSIGTILLAAQLSLAVPLMGLPARADAEPSFEAAQRAREKATSEGEDSGSVDVPIEATESEVMTVGREAGTQTSADLPLEEPLDPKQYVCGSGDRFELRFWGRQNLSVQMVADLEGNAFIPKVGKVHVAGKSLSDARARVLRAVRRYYPGLKTDLALIRPRAFMVHLVGDVKKPGLYRANPRMRVSAVLTAAGGPTGSVRRIQIRRRTGKVISADLLLYARTGDTALNPYLLDGDVVRIPKPGIEVVVSGPVRDPGRYELIAGEDTDELLALSGGLRSSTARSLPIRIVRRDRRERKTGLKLRFDARGRVPNTPLRDDDEVVFPSSGELERSVILVGAVVGADQADPGTTIKRQQYVEGDTVRTLIERAGGVTVSADLPNAYIKRDGARLRGVNLQKLLIERDFRADRKIQIGDTIVVPFKRRSIVVEGAVVRAGAFQYNPRYGIREYLASAGGTSRYAQDEDDIRVFSANGTMRAYDDVQHIAPGDTIVVPERNFTRSEIVQLVMSGAGLVLSAAALSYAVTR